MSTDPVVVPPVLVFDGDCAFCSSSVRAGERWIGRMPAAVPYQTTDLGGLGLTTARCEQAVQYVEVGGVVHSGEDAVSALLRAAGKGWRVLGAAMRLPGLHWLSGVLYRWVAANRHRLPGGTPACSLNGRR
jgi:predicted DCC family thiol-disulfide oxidoreductase YuxK